MKNNTVVIDDMEPGEIQLREIFERVTTNNVRTVADFTQETRELTRKLEEDNRKLHEHVLQLREQLESLRRLFATTRT